MTSPAASGGASRLLVVFAFIAVYLIWGSTYLAIRFVIVSLPPLLMAGARFAIAGLILYCLRLARGASRPTAAHWKFAAISGTLMLLGGNGLVCLAEQWVPSSLAALIISSVPIWIGVMHWAIEPARRPGARGIAGLVVGFIGVAILVHPGAHLSGGRQAQLGTLMLLGSAATWAAGSLYTRRAAAPADPILSTSIQMLAGSAALVLAAAATGEIGRVHLDALTPRAILSFLYLIAFGSIVAFTAYTWLLKVTAPAKVATYAYVNPIVAMALGAWLGGEAISRLTLVAAVIVIGSVIVITTDQPRRSGGRKPS